MNQAERNLIKYIEKCMGIDNTKPTVYNNGNGTYGIEFEGYQTVKITVEPVFDMDAEELDALVNLLANGLPLIRSIMADSIEKDTKIEALIDCIAVIANVGADRMSRVKDIHFLSEEDIDEVEVGLTVGEK